jgi:ABC-type transporter Mla subunit MlaD
MPALRRILADRGVPARVLAARVVVVVLLVPLGFYLLPRAIALVEIPTEFNESLDHGRTDADVAEQLQTLVGQIRTQVQPVLNQTNGQVDDLLGALDDLRAQLTSLTDPVADIRRTVAGDREELARILTRAQHIAADVRRARESARSAAENVAGPNR